MDTTNIEGTVCAYLQEWSEILETLYTYCIENGIIKTSSPCYADGIMIEAENYDESLLTSLTKSLKKRLDWI
jgi:hypothetical protein